MRMRQSPAQLERAFVEETELDRDRRESLRRAAIARSRRRRAYREVQRGKVRWVLLCLTLVATAVIVTIAMFRALYLVIG
jgi:hypothetical protein